MAAKRASHTFKKYTLEPTGFWQKVGSYFQIDSGRSSGVPLNPLFRNPPPGGVDPKLYLDAVTVPAADLAENPYWKRDTRRAYPKLSVVSQGDVVALLTVGSKANPKDDVLQLGAAGSKQLVALKEEGKETGLATYFQKDQQNMAAVLGPGGMPPMAPSMSSQGKRYDLLKDQSYENAYPCRTFV